MDKQTIKDFVKSVAEIKELKPVTNGERPADGETEVLYDGQWVTLDKKTNPTLGFKFIKLKEIKRDCMLGCGKQIANQLVETRLATHPELHWRTRCATCGQFVNPEGDGFIKGGHEVQAEFIKYFKSRDK